MLGRYCIASAVVLSILPAVGSTASAVQIFSPSCQNAAPGTVILDPEFDPYTLTAAWVTNPVLAADGSLLQKGTVSIAPIDPTSGLIVTRSAIVVDDADPVHSDVTKNGPEWGCSQGTCSVYFTSYLPDRSSGRLAKIARGKHGGWKLTLLPLAERKISPMVSREIANPGPEMIYYADVERFDQNAVGAASFGWRADERPVVDYSMPPAARSGRWAPGAEKLIITVPTRTSSEVVKRIAEFDTKTREVNYLFSDARNRVGPFPWSAPEFRSQTAVASLVEGESFGEMLIEVSRRDSGGSWRVHATLRSPDPEYPLLHSAEPFVFAGRSFLSFAGFEAQDPAGEPAGPSQIWIATVDGSFFRKVSVDERAGDASPKFEPEPLVINQGRSVVVYYNDFSSAEAKLMVCQTGLY